MQQKKKCKRLVNIFIFITSWKSIDSRFFLYSSLEHFLKSRKFDFAENRKSIQFLNFLRLFFNLKEREIIVVNMNRNSSMNERDSGVNL